MKHSRDMGTAQLEAFLSMFAAGGTSSPLNTLAI
jgi:hypothetical protein